MRVFLIDRDSNRCEAVAERTGGFPIIGDVGDLVTVERAVNAAMLAGGGLSALVYAVPPAAGAEMDAIRRDEFSEQFENDVAVLLQVGMTALRAMQIDERGVLLRIDLLAESETTSRRVIRSAQNAAWLEVAATAAQYGVTTETMTVAVDADPDAVAVSIERTILDALSE